MSDFDRSPYISFTHTNFRHLFHSHSKLIFEYFTDLDDGVLTLHVRPHFVVSEALTTALEDLILILFPISGSTTEQWRRMWESTSSSLESLGETTVFLPQFKNNLFSSCSTINRSRDTHDNIEIYLISRPSQRCCRDCLDVQCSQSREGDSTSLIDLG